MSGDERLHASDDFEAIKPMGNAPVAPAHGIAAIALNMAMKYCDINTVKDGVLYQQYRLEGKNMQALHLDTVFETAIRIEEFLLGSSERIAKLVIDALVVEPEEDENQNGGENGTLPSPHTANVTST